MQIGKAKTRLCCLLIILAAQACAPATPPQVPTRAPIELASVEPPSAGSPTPQASPTIPTRILTPSPTSPARAVTPQVTLTPGQAFQFKELIVYVGGGGGSTCAPKNELPIPDAYIDRYGSNYPSTQRMYLCIIDFPAGAKLDARLYSPSGRLAGTYLWQVGLPIARPFDQGRYTLIEVPGVDSFAIEPGDWLLKIASAGDSWEFRLPFGKDESTLPVVTQSRLPAGANANPFDPDYYAPYRAGEVVTIGGLRYPASIDLPIALYAGKNPIEVYLTASTHTDSQGSFSVEVTLEDSDPDGFYSLVPSIAIGQEQNEVDLVVSSIASFQVLNKITYSACPNAPPTRLRIGGHAQMVDATPSNLRFSPDEDATGKIFTGETVRVLEGPECYNGYVWWNVHDLTSGLVGWMAEGNQEGYWLEPK